MESIVTLPDSVLSQDGKICNTIISHFYGARGIHQIFSAQSDPALANVDFERVAAFDPEYISVLKSNAANARSRGSKFYGTTELHTSLQTAARNYCRDVYANPTRPASMTDILEWVASFIKDGTTQRIRESRSLRETFAILKSKPGVGDYYAYHCSTSNSVNPALAFTHDERFCAPGPGARKTLERMFPQLYASGRRFDPGDLVIWFRENQRDLVDVEFHPATWNVVANGTRIFEDEQDELKTYGTEVAMCQFEVYNRLRENPHLIKKRKVVRLEDSATSRGTPLF